MSEHFFYYDVIATCMAHCLLPPGEVQRQKNHFRSVEQLRRIVSPNLVTLPFWAGWVDTILTEHNGEEII